jgi:hypothetical protein
MRLANDEKVLLGRVLGLAGGKENGIRNAIIRVLMGERDRARIVYLQNILTRDAKEKIRRAQKNAV